MLDPFLLCIIGLFLSGLSFLYDRYVKYFDSRSPGLAKKEENIQHKLRNNEKLTKGELFHLYAYKVWNIVIKIGIYGGITLFLIGCFIFITT